MKTFRRFLSLLLCGACLLSFAACTDSGADTKNPSSPENYPGSSNTTSDNMNSNTPTVDTGKTLVVYFSMPDNEDNSSVVIGGETLGNTQYMAYVIAENTGADIFRIEPEVPYTTDHDALVEYAQQEKSENARPAIKDSIENFDEYNTVFVGYPNWWADLPMILYTFFDTYDFSGKTIITFNTHGGSGFSRTNETIAELEPNAEVIRGLSISRDVIQDAEQDIVDWVKDLGLYHDPNTVDDTSSESENTPAFNLAVPTPGEAQTIYLWEEGKMPCPREYSSSWNDPEDFKPHMEYRPVKKGVEVKGAVMLCAGGAFVFRGNWGDTYPTADKLNELGYQCFVVQYRLRPFTQEEGALDLARAVRYVRYYADEYDIDPNDIAVVGYSAGGILCGEQVLNWKGDVTPAALDENYIPDTLDLVSADSAAIGHIYSFYGRLSVGSTDVEKFRQSNLPPTFYAYGTEDPFYHQFMANADAVREAGVSVEEHCYDGQPHGFGAGNKNSDWVPEFDCWLTDIYENN